MNLVLLKAGLFFNDTEFSAKSKLRMVPRIKENANNAAISFFMVELLKTIILTIISFNYGNVNHNICTIHSITPYTVPESVP